uniref:Macoilin n=1 Tax=Mesocestoides corti TaxID=53468 RepID=A0A5K3FT84_MESCO
MADGRRNRRMQEGMQEACPCVCVHAVTAETLTAQCGGPRSPTLRPLLGLWGALDEAKWLLTRFEPRRITPERGVCVPTVAMCFLFLYVEVAVRLRDPKTIPLSVDLCRPFAAHCHPHALCLSPFRFFCVFIRGTTALTSVLSQVGQSV